MGFSQMSTVPISEASSLVPAKLSGRTIDMQSSNGSKGSTKKLANWLMPQRDGERGRNSARGPQAGYPGGEPVGYKPLFDSLSEPVAKSLVKPR